MTDDFFWFALFVAFNSLLLLILGLNVSRLRIFRKISMGDGDSREMIQAVRAHGNGVEQVVIFGLVVLALTLLRTSDVLMATLVMAFTSTRILHAWGMLFRKHNARRIGAGLTYLLQGVAVIALFANIV